MLLYKCMFFALDGATTPFAVFGAGLCKVINKAHAPLPHFAPKKQHFAKKAFFVSFLMYNNTRLLYCLKNRCGRGNGQTGGSVKQMRNLFIILLFGK